MLKPVLLLLGLLIVAVNCQAQPTIQQGMIRVGNLDRTYLYYAPANLPRSAPLLLAFHGSGSRGEEMRGVTGYEFEGLADQNGFVVVYPDGYKGTWNDCRKGVPLAANADNIDDLDFVRALITRFQADYAINPARVFAMGYSNGGHLAYRLAVEIPDEIAAVAAVAANFSADDYSDCRASGKPIAVLIINGTADISNPYEGGRGAWGATVRSTQATAEYFVRLNGQTSLPKTTHQDTSGPFSVDRAIWNDAGKPEVVLITVIGGGHTVPKFSYLDGPSEIWEFFSRQQSLK